MIQLHQVVFLPVGLQQCGVSAIGGLEAARWKRQSVRNNGVTWPEEQTKVPSIMERSGTRRCMGYARRKLAEGMIH
jgi:hypothetical protein